MLNLITLPLRFVRKCRFALIILGALIGGFGLWMQINGVPPAVEPVIVTLRSLLMPVLQEQATIFGMFSKIGGVMALLGLLGMTIHDITSPKVAPPVAKAELALLFIEREPATSTWQERLAAKTEPQIKLLAAPAPRLFGSKLWTGVIGAVFCAFLGALGATFLGNAGAGPADPTLALANLSPAQAMIQGHLANAGAADLPSSTVVSAAGSFAIPKLDPAALVPWVKEQLALALTGDQTAMITLGSIVGGIFVLLLGLTLMFALRRDKARQQTSTRRTSYS